MEKGKIQLTQKDAENTPAGGVVVGKRDGQTMIYDDASLGGYFVGKLHSEGGIKMINKSTGQPLEVQGSEIIITAPAVNDPKKHNFNGQMMTNREILSKINSDGGGVSFADGGEIPAKIHTTDKEYEYGGKMVHDSDIAHSLGMNSTLKKGKQHFSLGGKTYGVDAIYNAVKKNKLRLKTKEVPTFAMKYPVYDKQYSETVKTDFRKPNGITVRTESGEEVLIDGNHRMNNAYLKGRKTMKTYYIEDPKQIAKFTKKSNFELGGENNDFKKLIEEKFSEGYGKVKHFELNSSGGSWSYINNPNVTRSQRDKMPVYTVELANDVKDKATEIKKNYEISQPKEISILQFAEKFAKNNNGKIYHKSKSGSVYVRVKDKEIRISDHNILDRDSMNPKNRYDLEIIQRYFDEKTPSNLDYWTDEFKKGGELLENKNFKYSKPFGEITIFTNVEQEYVGDNYSPFENKGSFKATIRKGDLENIALESKDLANFNFEWGVDNWTTISKKLKQKNINELELYSVGKQIKTFELRPLVNDEQQKGNYEFKNGGHLGKGKSLKQIAEMHNVSLAHVNEELNKGLEVEKEHFSDFKERTRVAKDHLVENPNYYSILAKAGLEKGGKIEKEDLVKDAKSGNTPARDLNNYNDLMDVQADGEVGGNSGVFGNGGVTPYDANLEGDSFPILSKGAVIEIDPEKLKKANALLSTLGLDPVNKFGQNEDEVGKVFFGRINEQYRTVRTPDGKDVEILVLNPSATMLKASYLQQTLVKNWNGKDWYMSTFKDKKGIYTKLYEGKILNNIEFKLTAGTPEYLLISKTKEISQDAFGNQVIIANAKLIEIIKKGLDLTKESITVDYNSVLGVTSNPNKTTPNSVPKVEKVTIKETKFNRGSVVGRNASTISELQFIVRDYLGYSPKEEIDWIKFYVNDNTRGSYYIDLNKGKKNTVKNVNPETLNSLNFKRVIDANTYLVRNYDWTDFFNDQKQTPISSQAPASNSNKPFDLANTKIWIGYNPELSKRVQEYAFANGFSWANGGEKIPLLTEEPSLVFDKNDFTVTYRSSRGDFEDVNSREITEDDIFGTQMATNTAPASTTTKGNSVNRIAITYDSRFGTKNGLVLKNNTLELFEFLRGLQMGDYKNVKIQPVGSQLGVNPIPIDLNASSWENILTNMPQESALKEINRFLYSFYRDLDFDAFVKATSSASSQTTTQPTVSTTSQPFDLANTKIWIGDNRELSKRVQEYALANGSQWSEGSKVVLHEKAPALIFAKDNQNKINSYITFRSNRLDFDNVNFREITEADIFGTQTPISTQAPASISAKPFDFTDTKIDVINNPDLSLRVQKKAFEDGWEWEKGGGKNINNDKFNYLYFTKTSISSGNTTTSFVNSPKRKITEADVFGNQIINPLATSNQSQYPEYYELIRTAQGFTKGKIYKIKNPKDIGAEYNFIDDEGNENGFGSLNNKFFAPSTEGEFLKQQAGSTTSATTSTPQSNTTKKPKLEGLFVSNGDSFSNIEQVRYYLDNRTAGKDEVFFYVKNSGSNDFVKVVLSTSTPLTTGSQYYNRNAGIDFKYESLNKLFKATPSYNKYDWTDFLTTTSTQPTLTPLPIEDLLNSKMWIGDNVELKDKVIEKLIEIGLPLDTSVGDENFSKNVYVQIYNSDFVVWEGLDSFNNAIKKEIFPIDLGIDVTNISGATTTQNSTSASTNLSPITDIEKTKIWINNDYDLAEKVVQKAEELGWTDNLGIKEHLQEKKPIYSIFFTKKYVGWFTEGKKAFDEMTHYKEIFPTDLGINVNNISGATTTQTPTSSGKFTAGEIKLFKKIDKIVEDNSFVVRFPIDTWNDGIKTEIFSFQDDFGNVFNFRSYYEKLGIRAEDQIRTVSKELLEKYLDWKDSGVPTSASTSSQPNTNVSNFSDSRLKIFLELKEIVDKKKLTVLPANIEFKAGKDEYGLTLIDEDTGEAFTVNVGLKKIKPIDKESSKFLFDFLEFNKDFEAIAREKIAKSMVGFVADESKLYTKDFEKYETDLTKSKKDLEDLKKLLPAFQETKFAPQRAMIISEIKKLNNKITKEGFIFTNELMSSANQLFTPQGLLKYYFDQTTQSPVQKLEPACNLPTPNGMKSKLPLSAYFNVRTKQFKDWFGDWEKAYETNNYFDCSKAIDEETKEPKIFFHGVRKYIPNFGQFSNMGQGVVRPYGSFEPPSSFPASFFSDSEEYAKFYGGIAKNMPTPSPDYEPFIYKVFLSIKNELNLVPLGFEASYKDVLDYLYVAYGIKKTPSANVLSRINNDMVGKHPVWVYIRNDISLLETIKEYGYDTLVQIGDIPTFDKDGNPINDRDKSIKEEEFLTFYPNQVKSATVLKSFYFDFFKDIRFNKGGYVCI